MPYVGFEPTIPASERAKTVHALARSATVTGSCNTTAAKTEKFHTANSKSSTEYDPGSVLPICDNWSTVYLEKLTVAQLVQKLPTLHGSRRTVSASTSNGHWKISWTVEYSPYSRTLIRFLIVNIAPFLCLDSVVGITTSYGLDKRGVGVRVPVGSRIFFSPCRPDRLWVHPTSYPVGTGGKAAGAWNWPLTSS
jgi:hypothetical protein